MIVSHAIEVKLHEFSSESLFVEILFLDCDLLDSLLLCHVGAHSCTSLILSLRSSDQEDVLKTDAVFS